MAEFLSLEIFKISLIKPVSSPVLLSGWAVGPENYWGLPTLIILDSVIL